MLTRRDLRVGYVEQAELGPALPGLPGTVLRADRQGIEVACLKGSLIIEELQLAGKKRLDAASFLAGYAIPAGAQFSSDPDGGSPT